MHLNLALSPSAKQVLLATPGESLDLWLHNLERGTASRVTSDPAADGVAAWAPDGSQFVFATWRDGSSDFYVKSMHGASAERPLFRSSQTKYPSDWSTDGRKILYDVATADSGLDVWVLPVSSDTVAGRPEPYLQSEFSEWRARFSPDGRWVVYCSSETGRDEVYIQSYPPGKKKFQVSTNGGCQPEWRADGREIFYLGSDRWLNAVPIQPGVSLRAGAGTRLFLAGASPQGLGQQYAADRDGNSFVVLAQSPGPLTVVLNWHPKRPSN